jgi:hypothetical protein
MSRAGLQNPGHFFGGAWKADDVWQSGNVVRLAAAMVLADGDAVVDALAEQVLELGDGGLNRPRTYGRTRL